MIFNAPYPHIQTGIVLPQPILQNSKQPLNERDYRIMMDKTVYSYVKRLDQSTFSYSFKLTRLKSIEVIAFIESYIGVMWEIIDHHDTKIHAYCISNPNSLTAYRGPIKGPCYIDGYSINEGLTLDLEFEGQYA